jgi:hypothetical protein
MSGQQKRGFRLPWNAERGSDEGSAAATIDQGTLDSAPAAVGDDLGERPFARAEKEPAKTMDAAPAASDVPDGSAEANMIETDSMQDRIDRATDGVWPPTDRATEAEQAGGDATGPAGAAPDATPERVAVPVGATTRTTPKRENPLVAGLVKAMREAALASRSETTTRLQAEAAARIESIRAESTDEAAALRKRVDEDIAGIREWSKVEMARIRAETEHRIEERRADAINESQRHLDSVEELVQRVQATVAAFESDMDGFFERLLAETDPGRLAALAEQVPDAPDLSGDLPAATGWTTSADASANGTESSVEEPAADEPATEAAEATAEPAPETAEATAEPTTEAAGATDEPTTEAAEATAEPVAEAAEAIAEPTGEEAAAPAPEATAAQADVPAEPVALEAHAAAQAEVAASEGLDLGSREWPAAFMAAARRAEKTAAAPVEGGATSQLLVTGLTSVAGISAFKGAIGGLAGVRSVSVSTGERGVFVYSVNHEEDTDLAAAIAGLSAFSTQVTASDGGSLTVTAHEPAL